MSPHALRCTVLAIVAVLAIGSLALPAGASARPAGWKPLGAVCGAAGLVSGLAGKACKAAGNAGRLVSAGKKLLGGHVGGALKTVLGSSGGTGARAALGFAALAAWGAGGSRFALDETAKAIDATSSPRLAAPWFSAVYWRVAGIAVLLTLPFLFAAAVQGMLRSDPGLLVRCAFGYLPLAMLGVGVAAQVTSLLLTLIDQLSALVSSAAGHAASHFMNRAGAAVVLLAVVPGSPFIAFFVAVLTVAAAALLWTEMLAREAAVYVVVALLPLAFCAMVWPARRVWALRAVELLVALILSKLAIVAVLSLGTSALGAGGPLGFMAGIALLALAAFAPWAMLRLVPFAELASDAAGRLRPETRSGSDRAQTLALGIGDAGHSWASATIAQMRRDAERGGVDAGTAPPQVDSLGDGVNPGVDGEGGSAAGDGPPGGPDVAPGGGGGLSGRSGGDGSGGGPRGAEPATEDLAGLWGSPGEGGEDELEPWLQGEPYDWGVYRLGPDQSPVPGARPAGADEPGEQSPGRQAPGGRSPGEEGEVTPPPQDDPEGLL